MFWILLVLYVLLFMFNMGINAFTQFYRIRYRNKGFCAPEIGACAVLSTIPVVNLIATGTCILELIETLYDCSIKDLIEKLCRIGLK